MPFYRALTKTFYDNVLREPGDLVEADDSPGKYFELVEQAAAKPKKKAKGETLAGITEKPAPDNPETLADLAGDPGKDFI